KESRHKSIAFSVSIPAKNVVLPVDLVIEPCRDPIGVIRQSWRANKVVSYHTCCIRCSGNIWKRIIREELCRNAIDQTIRNDITAERLRKIWQVGKGRRDRRIESRVRAVCLAARIEDLARPDNLTGWCSIAVEDRNLLSANSHWISQK